MTEASATSASARFELMAALGDVHKKHLDPASPAPMRMMAARGLVPLPPREMVIVLAGYCSDSEVTLADAAKAALTRLPDRILGPVLDTTLPAAALTALAPLLSGREELLEKLVLAKSTPNEVVAAIAAAAPARIVEIIAQNQERCLACEGIVRALRGNSCLLRSSLDMLFDFLVRAGVIYDDMPEFADAIARLSPADVEKVAANVELPPEVAVLMDEANVDEAQVASTAEQLEAYLRGSHVVPEATGGPDDAPAAGDESTAAGSEAPTMAVSAAPEAAAGSAIVAPLKLPEPPLPMLKLINKLSVAKKVSLAVRGNKEARALLVRDRNRVVASAAIRNPRTTEQEVVAAAQSRSVCDEVIRIIAGSKDMTRSYGVKVALASNPKTPLPQAMRLLTLLRANDIKVLAKSRNVPSAIANQARRLLLAQGKK